MRGRTQVIALVGLGLTAAATGCSTGEKLGLSGGKTMNDRTARGVIERAEQSGALERGQEIEHFVGGGHAPPHYRMEQLRLIVRDGRTVFSFVTPDFSGGGKQGEAYPSHVYTLPAEPDEVRRFARLVRESGAFEGPPPPSPARPADQLRTELCVLVDGKEVKRVYPGAQPPELAKLQAMVHPLVVRLKAQGAHQVEP